MTGVFKRTTKGFRKFFGPFIALDDLSDLSIVTPPPANPYDIPELTDAPYIPADQINSMGKRRISGEVLAVWQGDRALLRAADGRAVNLTFARGFQPPPCGTRITAIGYPETDMVRLGLTKASFRVEPSAPQTNDTPIVLHSDADFISSQLGKQGQYENHGALVSLRGLLQSPPSADRIDNRMFVNVSGTTVPVDMGQHPEAARDIPAGSLIEVTGRFIVGAGRSSNSSQASDGGQPYSKDDYGGARSVTLTSTQIPKHDHTFFGDDQLTVGAEKTVDRSGYDAYSVKDGDSAMFKTGETGANKAHENRPPFKALYYIMKIR